MDAEIIAVGSELLTPHRLDTNSLYLTEKLNRLGIEVRLKTVVGDDRRRLAQVLQAALSRSSLIIATGGLGPTEDDVTREVFSQVLHLPLQEVDEIRRQIEERFQRYGRKMPAINLRQAQVPKGAEWLANPNGTAPGLWIDHAGVQIILLPGPPSELQPLFEDSCLDRLARLVPPQVLLTRVYKVAGLPESEVDQRTAPLYTPYPNPETTLLASPGEIEIHLRAKGVNRKEAEALLHELGSKIEAELGEAIFTSRGESLETVVGNLLRTKGMTLGVAEGCTGGRIAQRMTSQPGSSSFFQGGIVCYQNASKTGPGGIGRELIEQHGSASPEVCRALAESVRRKMNASLGLAVTGLCGPEGGTEEKPVGLVFIALADEQRSETRKYRFLGDRDRIQHQAAQSALERLRRWLLP